MEWIKSSDQPPPKDRPFLGYDGDKEDNSKIYVIIYVPERIYTGEYANCSRAACYEETGGECYFNWNPTHWMPLPKPPEEE